MLRIHFTDSDMARVRVAARPDPFWETVLGVQQMEAARRPPGVYAHWRAKALREVRERGLAGPVRMLQMLAPARAGYFPDFLTPAGAGEGWREGLEALKSTPARQVADEVQRALRGRARVPLWCRQLAAGDRARMAEVGQALTGVHRSVIAPDWSRVSQLFESDRAVRTAALRDGGVEGLLGSLRPMLRWEPPVLTADYPEERDLYLAGRGLRLVPAFFCWRQPVALADPELPQVLVYPVQHGAPARPAPEATDPRELAVLLGSTRAQVLAALAAPASTAELAGRLGVAASSVSEHVGALRRTRLAHSRRVGSHVLHTLTPLGRALLCGEQ